MMCKTAKSKQNNANTTTVNSYKEKLRSHSSLSSSLLFNSVDIERTIITGNDGSTDIVSQDESKIDSIDYGVHSDSISNPPTNDNTPHDLLNIPSKPLKKKKKDGRIFDLITKDYFEKNYNGKEYHIKCSSCNKYHEELRFFKNNRIIKICDDCRLKKKKKYENKKRLKDIKSKSRNLLSKLNYINIEVYDKLSEITKQQYNNNRDELSILIKSKNLKEIEEKYLNLEEIYNKLIE